MDVASPLEQRYSQQGHTLPSPSQQLPSATLRPQPADLVAAQQPPVISTAQAPHTNLEQPKLLYKHISNLPTNGVVSPPPSNVNSSSQPDATVPAVPNTDNNQASRGPQPPPNTEQPSQVNGNPSAIPRARPSGIPRFSNFPLPSSTSLELSSTGSNNNNAGVRANGHHMGVTSPPPPSEPSQPTMQVNSQPGSTPLSPLSAPPLDAYNQPVMHGLSRPPLGHMDLANHDPGRAQQFSGRSRAGVRSAMSAGARCDRAISEHPHRPGDTESDTSSVFSSSGTPRVITSKINSLKNVHHKPGGGNVAIVNEKVQLGPIKSKCNSLANVKHKPGGGNIKIVDEKIDLSNTQSRINSLQNAKHVPAGGNVQPILPQQKLNFSQTATPKVGSFANAKHKPAGGNVQIVTHKLDFDKTAKSKVGSLKNAHHRPGGGDVQIYNETLPWLKYNKPNLPPDEKARINKQISGNQSGGLNSSMHSGSTRS